MTNQRTLRTFGRAEARAVLPRRKPGAHKWGVGGLMIFAGSPGYIGAAALSAMAAGRAGAGIVNLAVSRGIIGSIAAIVPEAAFTALPEGELGGHSKRLFDVVDERAKRCDAFVIGPGLGDDDYARDLVATLLGLRGSGTPTNFGFGAATSSANTGIAPSGLLRYEKPILVDADGLNALAKIENWWDEVPAGRLILTPHVGELGRLLDVSIEEILADPIGAIGSAADKFEQVVVLKGKQTLIAYERDLFQSADTPPSLATAGTGDVLAGTIGAFLAQGLKSLDAINLAVFLGTEAAKSLERELGTLGIVASDLPRAIAGQLALLERG